MSVLNRCKCRFFCFQSKISSIFISTLPPIGCFLWKTRESGDFYGCFDLTGYYKCGRGDVLHRLYHSESIFYLFSIYYHSFNYVASFDNVNTCTIDSYRRNVESRVSTNQSSHSVVNKYFFSCVFNHYDIAVGVDIKFVVSGF